MPRSIIKILLITLTCLVPGVLFAAGTELAISSAAASSYAPPNAAARAIDNNLFTSWEGSVGVSGWWLEFDLGKVSTLHEIVIWWRPGFGASNYNIQISDDRVNWTNLYTSLSSGVTPVNVYKKVNNIDRPKFSVSKNPPALPRPGVLANLQQVNYGLSGRARYIRIDIKSAQKSYPVIGEVKIYAPDTTPPTGAIIINNNEQYTTSVNVTLSLSATDLGSGIGNSGQMQLSNDGTNWLAPEAFVTTKSWALAAGDDTKTVYVKYRDAAGNWSSAYSDSIILDTTPPAQPNMSNLVSPANLSYQTIAGTKSADTVLVSVACPTANVGSATFPAATSWVCPLTGLAEGKNDIIVRLKDGAGLESPPVTFNIISDTHPPAILLDPVKRHTNQDVNLSYTVNDNLTPANQIVFSGNNSPYVNEGDYNITLTAIDLAGNSVTNAAIFTIDKTKPAIVINSPANGAVFEDAQVNLSGTVDGAAFSEAITLHEGENVLTKSAKDLAGNESAASVKVHLYSGQAINPPEGGEFVSPDGMAKLKIPPNALNAVTKIRMLPVELGVLKQAVPEGKVLLSAIECKPDGTQFNTPATLTYMLPQAQVPGTPVELGLYDSNQNKIIGTGQISTVPVDGYTLNFSVNHFSTYAALANLAPQGAPMGMGVKIPLPDMLTGAFSHSVAITVSPGRKRMQPNLNLVYRSSNPNSWVGQGYSLNCGYIVRSTRLGAPSYNDTQDTFYFVTDAGTTELVRLIDNLYQARIESGFTKFFKEADDSWRAVDKGGNVLKFGQTAPSKEVAAGGTFSWYLTEAVDTNGNYIEYTYIKDKGKCYLKRIDYTGNKNTGKAATNSVEFFLETRQDVPSSYASGSKISTALRLQKIEARVNFGLVWEYILEYEYSQDTNRSLIKSVTQKAADSKTLPVQKFDYQKAK